MTVESERRVYAMQKNRRLEPQFAKMTVENTLKV